MNSLLKARRSTSSPTATAARALCPTSTGNCSWGNQKAEIRRAEKRNSKNESRKAKFENRNPKFENRNSKNESGKPITVPVIPSEAKNPCSCFIFRTAEILRSAQNDRRSWEPTTESGPFGTAGHGFGIPIFEFRISIFEFRPS